MLEKHKGKVPKTFEELEKLPGVGHKTASVVMSQGFGYPAFAVDTHIHKTLLSLLKIEKTVSGGSVANSIVGLSKLK